MPDNPSTPDPQPATPSGDIRNAPGDTGDPQVPHTRGEREDQAAAELAGEEVPDPQDRREANLASEEYPFTPKAP
jgi:hypothetical protein